MKRFEIFYNPYEQETRILVNNHDIKEEPAYSRLRKIIEKGTPLQSWIDPIPHKSWEGFINEMVSSDCYDEVEIIFHGREIDYEDLQRACDAGNAKREKEKQLLIKYMPLKDKVSDAEMAKNVEKVKRQIMSDEFAKIVYESKENLLIKREYERLTRYYSKETDKEFKVVFAGVFSSGKSTILNTLIRHEVLPTAGGTCTAKICRIKHDAQLKNKIRLSCYDEDNNIVVPAEIFEKDEDCYKRFYEITPLNAKSSVPPEVHTIELNLDLSHLYPSKEMEEKFTLVLVDTPGCDSPDTSDADKEINEHKEIAKEAINSSEKEMVILCTPANRNFTLGGIGDFIHEIFDSMQKDSGEFNDRFLFVQNLCDKATYDNEQETLEGKKAGFAKKLMNPSQYGFKKGENAPDFIPRILMLSAGVQLAIQKGLANLDEDEVDLLNKKEQTLHDDYKGFRSKIKRENHDYFLTDVCDIPEYRKAGLQKKFEEAMQDRNFEKAVSIQTGMECLEIAIKDYIERYAYPFKIRALRKSFGPLLEAVVSQTETENRLLDEHMVNLGKDESEKKEVELQKKTQEEIKSKLDLLKKKVKQQEDRINQISFDRSEFKKISDDVEVELEKSDIIGKARVKGAKYKKDEMDELFVGVENAFSFAFADASVKFEKLNERYQKQLEAICKELKCIVEELKSDKEYCFYGYKFEDSLGVKKLEDLDKDSLWKEVENTREKKTELKTKRNSIKDETYKWWQFGKRITRFFAPDTVTESVVEEYYSAEPLLKCLNDALKNFVDLCNNTADNYEVDIKEMGAQAKKMASDIPKSIEETMQRIDEFKGTLDECGQNMDLLNEKVKISRDKLEFLHGLIKSIEFGGNENE